MRIKNDRYHYGIVAKLLHWLIAIFIITLLCVGLYMADLPVGLQKLKLYRLHKEFGLLVLGLAIVRICWRIINTTPLLELPWWEACAARLVHWAFYGFMFAMPLSGWLMSSASGISVSFFGLFVMPNLVGPDDNLRIFFRSCHHWLAYALIATIVLHVLAALKHHFIDNDTILRRMTNG